LAVKIVRQPNKIALIGVPTSAAAHNPGLEKAPAALRAAGLVEKLQAAGYEVADIGDCPQQVYQPDDEHPRARNTGGALAVLNALKPHVEHATKSGALPLILGGDCTIALATVAGQRRYYRSVSLLYFDRDADLNVPATTPSGILDGMGISHIIGRGAPELVRFWGQPPLVREPEIALFGLDRVDPPEQALLESSPIRQYRAADVQQRGAEASAREALERIHGTTAPFILHFDVDVMSGDDFPAANLPAPGGLRADEVRQALEVFVTEKNLSALEVTEYNPERDADGSAARFLVDMLVAALAKRLAVLTAPPPAEEAPAPSESAEAATAATEARPAEAAPSAPEEAATPTEASAEPAAEKPPAPPAEHPAESPAETPGETPTENEPSGS
jgi:arginase